MSMFLELIPTGVLQGLVLAFVALGVFVPFRILNFPDLTSEGSYPLGGIICATLLVGGVDPILALLVSGLCGGLLGLGTALIHICLKVNTLVCGLILTTMAYSINLRLMGKPNLSLFDQVTIFTSLGESIEVKSLFILGVLIFLIIVLFFFLKTEKGLRFRSVGLSPLFSERQGINVPKYMILGLFTGNMFCGLAGGLMAQIQGYVDVGMGFGLVLHVLAALIIGEGLIKNKSIFAQLFAPFLGAIVYQQIQGFVVALGLEPSDLKFFTGLLVLSVIALREKTHKRRFFP
ncbi:MAG TPA: ABC transporter permease [Alphaproteobacteria bacterium]|nr:ABC transporter permease [Alphaproteobacteria bacterium]HQS93525.1 ABC transporter permease [Alphaproteobacteria bacterium]